MPCLEVDLIGIGEASRLLGLSTATLSREVWREKFGLRSRIVGRQRLFDKAEIIRLRDAHQEGAVELDSRRKAAKG